jgi:hypothetical protein
MGELNWVGPFQALPVSEKFSNYNIYPVIQLLKKTVLLIQTHPLLGGYDIFSNN